MGVPAGSGRGLLPADRAIPDNHETLFREHKVLPAGEAVLAEHQREPRNPELLGVNQAIHSLPEPPHFLYCGAVQLGGQNLYRQHLAEVLGQVLPNSDLPKSHLPIASLPCRYNSFTLRSYLYLQDREEALLI